MSAVPSSLVGFACEDPLRLPVRHRGFSWLQLRRINAGALALTSRALTTLYREVRVSSQATTHERQRDRYDLAMRETPGRALQIGGATSESLEP
jgi:hypothetical protein